MHTNYNRFPGMGDLPGDPNHPLDARFDSRVQPVTESGCWLWTGAWDEKGYGRIYSSRPGYEYAHRASYRTHVGPIADGLHVCHKCDTPSCVNPNHLFLGTHADNMADRSKKGRCARVKTNARLTPNDVREIHALLSAGELTQKDIARKFGVTQPSIWKIKAGLSWKEIGE